MSRRSLCSARAVRPAWIARHQAHGYRACWTGRGCSTGRASIVGRRHWSISRRNADQYWHVPPCSGAVCGPAQTRLQGFEIRQTLQGLAICGMDHEQRQTVPHIWSANQWKQLLAFRLGVSMGRAPCREASNPLAPSQTHLTPCVEASSRFGTGSGQRPPERRRESSPCNVQSVPADKGRA